MTKKYPKYNEHEFIQKYYANKYLHKKTKSKHNAFNPFLTKTHFYRVSYN